MATENLVDMANFICRFNREQSFSRLTTIGISPTMNSLERYIADLSTTDDLKFIEHFYNATRYMKNIYGSNDYIVSEIGPLFNAFRGYIRLYHSFDSLGYLLLDELPGVLHVNSDYQYIHNRLYGYEDEFYYRLVGEFGLSVTPAGLSSHTGMNKFTLAMPASYKTTWAFERSFVPNNEKYTVSPVLSMQKTLTELDAGTFFAVVDTISADGTINENVELEFDRDSNFEFYSRTLPFFSNTTYEATRDAYIATDLTSGHHIIKYKELHITDEFSGTPSVQIKSGLLTPYASNFHTGTEFLNYDAIYCMENVQEEA